MASGGEQLPIALLVHDIPKGVGETDLEIFFNDRKNGGCGDIEEVTFPLDDGDRTSARITFETGKGAETIVKICSKPRTLNDRKLKLEKEMPQIPQVTPEGAAVALLVHDIPDDLDNTDLENFFNAQKNGGCGDIDEVTFPLNARHPTSARITFEKGTGSQSIERIMAEKRTIRGQPMRLEKEMPQDDEPVLYVHNVPDQFILKDVMAFFSRKKNGGCGSVERVQFPLDDRHPNSAKVVFMDEETIASVCSAERVMGGNVLVLGRSPPTADLQESDDVFLDVTCKVNPGNLREVKAKLKERRFGKVQKIPENEGGFKLKGDWDTLSDLRMCFVKYDGQGTPPAEDATWEVVDKSECKDADEQGRSALPTNRSAHVPHHKVMRLKNTLEELDPAVVLYLECMTDAGYSVIKIPQDYGLIKFKHDAGKEFCKVLFFDGVPTDAKREFKRRYEHAKRMSVGDRMNVPGICPGLVDRRIEATKHRRPDCAAVRVGEEIRLRGTQDAIGRELQALEMEVVDGKCGTDCAVCGDGRGGAAGGGQISSQPSSRRQSQPAAQHPPARDKTPSKSPKTRSKPDGPVDTIHDLDPAVVLYLEKMTDGLYGVVKKPEDKDLIRMKHRAGDAFCNVLFFDGVPGNARKEFMKSYDNAERMSVGDRMSVPGMCRGLVERKIKETNHHRPDCAAVRVGEEVKLRGTQDAIDRELQNLEMAIVGGACPADCHVCGTGTQPSDSPGEDDASPPRSRDKTNRNRHHDSEDRFGPTRGRQPTSQMSRLMGQGFDIGRVKVYCYKENIEKMSVDAVVNSTNDGFHLDEFAVGRALKNAAGRELQEECYKYVRDHGKVHPGEVIVTKGYDLPVESVFHIVCPKPGTWEKEKGKQENIAKVVAACLDQANVENSTSIAVPAIGAGSASLSIDKLTDTICAAVVKYCVNQSTTSALRVIHLVDVKDDTVKKMNTYMDYRIKEQGRYRDAGKNYSSPSKGATGNSGTDYCVICVTQKAVQRLSCNHPVCRSCRSKRCTRCPRY